MTITAQSGPIVVFGAVMTSTAGTGLLGNDTEHNDQRAPSLFDLGVGMMDPRAAYQYEPGGNSPFVGFYDGPEVYVDFVPTLGASAIVNSTATNVAAGAAYSLNTASSAVGTYATTIIAPETGRVTGSLLAFDSTAALLTFGSAGTMQMWNPAAGTGRCLSITTSSSGDAGTYVFVGRDMYGYKITEAVALSQGTSNSSGYTVNTQKAFKYLQAVYNSTTTTSTSVRIDIADIFEFPLYTPYTGLNAEVRLNTTSYSSTVLVALSSANVALGAGSSITQTSTTADVRGTFASTTASNGTLRLQMRVQPTAANIATITSTNVAPLFGNVQYSSV